MENILQKPKRAEVTLLERINWQLLLRYGLLSGLVIVFVAAVGMLESFNEREVIRQSFTLGQLLLFLPPVIAGFMAAHNSAEDENSVIQIGKGLAIGVLTTIPVLLLIFVSQIVDVRSIFVNINRQLIDFLSFENDRVLVGSLLNAAGLVAAGLAGSILYLLPYKIRRAIITGIGATLAVGMMGELVAQILEQLLHDDIVDEIFRRGVLKQGPALILFISSTASMLFWVFQGQQVRESFSSLPSHTQRNARFSGYTVLGIILLILPWILGSFLSEVMNNIGLFILMGLGLNIAIGLAGLLDLGYVTNFAVGAYVMAVLTSTGPLGRSGDVLNFWLVIPIALLAAMFAGFIFAVPVLKMRGDYLAIATLGFGEIIGKLAVSDWLAPIIGGAQGVLFIPNPNFFGIEIKDPEQLYYVILGACVITLIVSIRLNNSRTGRQWMAIREDEDVAAAMGINTARAKLLAFTLSAATGGVAGAILAAKVGTVFPNTFRVFVSINVLSLIIVGGMGSIPGIVIGAIVLIGMPELLREFSDFRWLIYGALLVFMMINRPEGLWPSKAVQRELRGRDGPVGGVPASNIDDPTRNEAPPDSSVVVE